MRRLLALLVLSTALVTAPVAGAQSAPPPSTASSSDSTLSVVGEGQVFVVPDEASVEATVRRTLPSAASARSSVSARTAAIIRSAVALGVRRADLQTSVISLRRLNLAPRHKGGRRRIRFAASATLNVTVRDVDLVGRLLDAATKAGADDLTGPSFEFSDPNAGREEAEQAALADARSRADRAAASQGQRVIGVRTIVLDDVQGVDSSSEGDAAPQAAAGASTGKATPTPTEPGRQAVDASVGVVYLLGPAS